MKNLFALIFLIIIILPFYNSYSQNSNINFEHFSVAQGMSEPIVSSVIQDRDGYLWFGTYGGIEKYDGYRFTAYTHLPNNPNSIDNTFVQTLYEDREGIIWVGTFDGLEKFDKRKSSFTHYKPHTPGPDTELSNHVLSICEDKFGMLWVGTGDGLNKFDKNSGKFICIRNDEKDPESISSNNISAILEDKAGSLWFGTGRGLDKLDRRTGKFIHFWYDPNYKSESSNYWVNTIFEDKSGILWLGTREGIVAFDQKAGTFTPYIKEINSVLSICEDESGHLWIGTLESGLYSFDIKTKKLANYLYDNNNPVSLNSNYILSICFEQSGTIWITSYDGVNKLNTSEKAFKHYRISEIWSIKKGRDNKIWINTKNGLKKLDSRTGQIIQSPLSLNYNRLLYEDKKGNLWFAKAAGGLVMQDKLGQITKFYTSTGEEFRNFADLIYEAQDGSIWIEANGFFSLDITKQKVKRIKIPDAIINCIYEDSYGLLWIATFKRGLYSYNRKTDSIKSYIYSSNDTTSISGRTIFDASEDKNGFLWVETNGGINKYDRKTDSFIHFTDKDGSARFASFTLLEDDSGNFWFNSSKGISKFNPAAISIKNYDVHDGLPENGFIFGRGVKSDDGRIYFANRDELIGFHPDNIQDNKFIPPIEITNFLKFDKSFPLQNEIQLPYNDNFISFEFAALNYISPQKNQYAYKMEGVDKEWIYSGTRRFTSYPNLDPGEYIFRVKGSNNDGVWNEKGTSVAIIISPPWWKTWWAYVSYTALCVFALYGIRRYELNRLLLKNQVKTERAVLIEREETDKMKSRFFANISHEFRTPLTLILGPAEKIISDKSDDIKKDANIIKRNSRRLLQLINQLLDLSKLEAGKLKLKTFKGNIVSFVKGVALSFESMSESKDITLRIQPEKEFIELYLDREKMMKILTNILSNAFKFTPAEGKITVSITEISRLPTGKAGSSVSSSSGIRDDNMKRFVEIKIRDTGIGITEEEIPKLFDRFYQVDSSHTREYEGTGIGLALTKELVELHYGSIRVESEKGGPDNVGTGWTEFILEFPLGRDHLKDEEIVDEKEPDTKVILIPPEREKNLSEEFNDRIYKTDSSSKTPQNDTEMNEDKTIILVVEDNYDMREYIKESLGSDYLIEEAVNGEQGVRKAEKIIPDLIISDIMMPKMDGNELTRILKNDEKTSHIPIILLTAKSEQESKLEGLKIGADDYLTKPFDIKELQVRIKNLISIRKKLQEKFSKIGNRITEVKQQKLSSIDEKFMFRVGEVIEKHISEEEFSIEEFCREVAMSRTQLHRKLKALTGRSTS